MNEHDAVATAMHDLTMLALAEDSLDHVLTQIAQIAKRVLAGASEVSVTLIERGRPRTAAYTSRLALELDETQYAVGRGPCLAAAADGNEVAIADMAEESRFDGFSEAAAAAGVHSSLSLPLPMQERVIGALNIYSTAHGMFDQQDADNARTFAGYAAVAVHNAQTLASSRALTAQMQDAMATRAVIEQAKGILMGQRRCTADEAFELLKGISQDTNRKLRDVAQALVDSAVATPH